MTRDAYKNFAKVTVSTGYVSTDTSIVLTTGDGAKLPAVPFNAVWWNVTDYPDPSDDPNVEIVRVTVRSTDTLTITRAQESTTATNKNTGSKTYKLHAGATVKLINTDISAPGSDTYVLFNDGGEYGANVNLTFTKATPLLSLISSPAANTAPTAGIEVKTTTAATSGNQRHSGGFFLDAQGFASTPAASRSLRFRQYVVATQGTTNPFGAWTMESAINGGSFGFAMTYDTAGGFHAAGSITSDGGNVSAAGSVVAGDGAGFNFSSRSVINSSANGAFEFNNHASTARSTVQHGDFPIIAKTTGYTILALDNGIKFTTTGAAGNVTFTLPTATVGQVFWFQNDAAHALSITAVGSDVFQWGSYTSGAAKTLATATKGFGCKIYCLKATVWIVEYATEGWTLDSLARCGNATMASGTIAVTNATVTANTAVMLSRKTISGTCGNLSYTLSAGTSFTINSDNPLDTSVVSWCLFEIS